MLKLRTLDDIDSATLERFRRDPCAFIEDCLVSPYTGEPYRLIPAEREFSKYPPAEPGALVLEPLEAACPCCFNSAALLRRGMCQHHVSEQSA